MGYVQQRVYLLRHGETEERFELVLTSPLQRARQTCELAGLGAQASQDADLLEWNYGEYEGLTPQQIRAMAPGWLIFRDGCPGGESPAQIGARVDRLIGKVRAVEGNAALFGHGHVLRVLAARWLDLPVTGGSHFLLGTATLSVLSYYHGIGAVERWNISLVT
jgi:probable phosphoglycerate mutase